MKYSKLFGKTIKQVPSGAESTNQQLLTRGGFINQVMAGVYTYLPLGWKVLNKISDIVREEMDIIEGQELLMPALHPADNWDKTGRLHGFDVLFRVIGSSGIVTNEVTSKNPVLGPTHEEIIYPLVGNYVKSYRDLPISLYQIQTKFRNEPRAKAGILRGREFIMKDLYSFHSSNEERDAYYEIVREAYLKVFQRIGLPVIETKAGGGTFSELSLEFQTVTPSGEDTVYVCENCHIGINEEVLRNINSCPQCGKDLKIEKAIEVGNIFPLKESFAQTFNVTFQDDQGSEKLVAVGCYGLGISRVMGAVVEVFHDDKGIIWPENIAPYKVHLVGLDLDDPKIKAEAEKIYQQLESEGVEVLFDDRLDASAGQKFADADLIGIPYRVVISKRTQAEGKIEFKKRSEPQTHFVSVEELTKMMV